MSTQRFVHRSCAVVIVSGLLGLGATVAAHAQTGLGMVPMRQELKLTPGQQVSGALKLSSQSGVPTRIRAEVDDFFVDETDTPQFERDIPHEAATSCKNWLTLNPMEIELDKGGSLLVRFTIHVPAGTAEGSYNCAAGFTTLPPADQAAAQGMGMHMQVRIVTAFYVQVGNSSVAGSLKAITLEAIPPPTAPAEGAPATDAIAPKGSWQAVVLLENSGKMFFRPTGTLEVLDADGKTVEKDDFPSMAVLRERSQRVIFPLKTNLQPGHYKLRVNVDIGTGEIQAGTVDVAVDAPPPAAGTKPVPK
jgi:hypothetical protein